MTKLSYCLMFTAISAIASLPAYAQNSQGPYSGHHMWGGGWHGWFMSPVMMIVFVAFIVVVVVLVVRWLSGSGHVAPSSYLPGKSPLDVLKDRFAKGEIDKDEYEERRQVLEE